MRPRLVALLVAAALTTGWMLASIVSPPVAELQTLQERDDRSAAPRHSSVETPFAEQLQLKMQSAPRAPVPRRNPFVFAPPPRSADRSAPAANLDAAPSADVTREPTPVIADPPLRLAGIGSTSTESGIVRTAVIADGRTVHLVKVGEAIRGYAVIEITDESVTVQNAAGAEWVLRLN